MSFTFPSYRRLCKYLGEVDAMVELTEVAARKFVADACRSGDVKSFVARASEEHSICVNLSEIDNLQSHLARHYIVTVYQSAERFLHEYRREHIALNGKEWAGDAHDLDPLTVAIPNIGGDPGKDLVDRFQYYRLIRNWVAHSKDGDPAKLLRKLAALGPYTPEHEKMFEKTPGPSDPDALKFEDFILFSRITKRLGERLCELGRPAEDSWVNAVPRDQFRNDLKDGRIQNAIAGWLRTEYGMDVDCAYRVAGDVLTHWRNGSAPPSSGA